MRLFIEQGVYIDTSFPLDISIPLSNTEENPRAWYVETPVFEPVRTKFYTGLVAEGCPVNFRNLSFNPHGHGTHTECLGHITKEVFSVNNTLKEFIVKAQLISVSPRNISTEKGEDAVIYPEQIDLSGFSVQALIIRTLPNDQSKLSRNYSNSNPPYFHVSCVEPILKAGVKHLLIDLPSVDRESDHGVLAFHHAFWEVPQNPNFERTITELIYVNDDIEDGEYILSLQMAPFENDASPSRPVLYKIKRVNV